MTDEELRRIQEDGAEAEINSMVHYLAQKTLSDIDRHKARKKLVVRLRELRKAGGLHERGPAAVEFKRVLEQLARCEQEQRLFRLENRDP